MLRRTLSLSDRHSRPRSQGSDALIGAQFLIRLRTLRQLPVLARLHDGSFLTRIGTVSVRIIEAEVTVHLQDGTVTAHRYRLATTLLDPAAEPAETLIGLYHERRVRHEAPWNRVEVGDLHHRAVAAA
jgi:hypothetical protein